MRLDKKGTYSLIIRYVDTYIFFLNVNMCKVVYWQVCKGLASEVTNYKYI